MRVRNGINLFKLTVIILLSFAPLICFSQGKQPGIISADVTEMWEGLIYFEGEDEPYTGVITEIETVDEAKARYQIVDGLEQGMQRRWYPNGKCIN